MTQTTLALVALLGLLFSPSPAEAGSEELSPLILGALDLYNEVAPHPVPGLSSKDLQKLLRGEVVKIRRREPRPEPEADPYHRVIGYLLVDQPQIQVWLAALDPDFAGSPMLTDHRIHRDETGRSRWYQHVALPWPVTDRHWVIDLGKGSEVYEASEGLIWEHRWNLAPGGEELARELVASGRVEGFTPETIQNAIYLPANFGGWVMVNLAPDKTLMVYHVTTDAGGSVPESWIATFAMAQLGGLLEQVAEAATDAMERYDPERNLIYDGSGQPIPRRMP